MNRRTPRRIARRRGTMVLEMIACLVLVSIAFTIASHLLHGILRIYRETPAAASLASAQTQWLGMLRNDAWSAHHIEVGDGSRFVLDGGAIQWRCESGTLLRETTESTLRWPCPLTIQWARDGSVSTVTDGTSVIALATPVAILRENAGVR